jgi:hypothetical protein
MKSVVALCFLLAVDATLAPVSAAAFDSPANLLKDVDTADGVSEWEADAIAKAYFARHVGCGSYGGVSDSPEGWVVAGRFGYAGSEITGFLIDKADGRVHSTIGPSYATPREMLQSATDFPESQDGLPRAPETNGAAASSGGA